MGACHSHITLAPDEVEWAQYVQQPWRSERTRTLDRLGGLSRAPISRGKSFNTKLEYLRDVVLQQAHDMSDTMQLPERTSEPQLTRPRTASYDHSKEAGLTTRASHDPNRSSWALGSPAQARKDQLEARRRMMEYGQRQSDEHSVGFRRRTFLDAPSTPQEGRLRMQPVAPPLQSKPALTPELKPAARSSPAEWRIRVYAARRRTILTVLVIVRLKLGASRAMPDRLRRVDSFSMYVPKVLDSSTARFAEEQITAQRLKHEMDAIKLIMVNSELCNNSTNVSEAWPVGPPGSIGDKGPDAWPVLLERMTLAASTQHEPVIYEEAPPSPSAFQPASILSSQANTPIPPSRGDRRLSSAGSTKLMSRSSGGGGLHGRASMSQVEQQGGAPGTLRTTSSRAMLRPRLSVDDRPNSFHQERNSAPAGTRHRRTADQRFSGLLGGPGSVSGTEQSRPLRTAISTSCVEESSPNRKESNGGAAAQGPLTGQWASYTDATAEALATIMTEMELVPSWKRSSWLSEALAARSAALAHSNQMMRMFVNRANAKFAEGSQPWVPASMWDSTRCISKLGNAAYESSAEEVRTQLTEGNIALSLMCWEDHLVLPDGRVVDLWAADPWKLVETVRPGCIPQIERVAGVPLGVRVILQLLASIQQALGGQAGHQAVQKLTLLLHCSDRQQGEVLAEVFGRRHFGLDPQNIIIMPQPTWPGHKYNPKTESFERDALGSGHTLGSGYSQFLLSWVGEGMVLGPEGDLVPLPVSVLETLERRGTEWLICRRLRDLALLSNEGALDLSSLATLLLLHRQAGANMGVWCSATPSSVLSRQLDSVVVVGNVPRSASGHDISGLPKAERTRLAKSRQGQSNHAQTFLRTHSANLAKHRAELGLQQVIELRHTELVSPLLQGALAQCKGPSEGTFTVGLGQYAFHLPSLRQLMVGFPFRARLSLVNGSTGAGATPKNTAAGGDEVLAITWDIADLLLHPLACCAPIRATISPQHKGGVLMFQQSGGASAALPAALPPTLSSLEDIPVLSSILQSQDHDPSFRRLLAEHQNARSVAHVIGPVDAHGRERPGQVVVVCVSNISSLTDTAVALAAQLVRPGQDSLHLVTVVPTTLAQREGEHLLAHYHLAALGCMANIQMECLVQHPWTMMDVLDWYIKRVEAGMVVMASTTLTSTPDVSAPHVLSSLTLSMIRRVTVPVMVITPNTVLNAPGRNSTGAAAAAAHNALGGPREAGDRSKGGASGHGRTGTTPAQAAVAAAIGAGGLRVLTLLERYSSPMMRWLCKVLHTTRGDQMLLAQVVAHGAANFKSQQQRLNFKTALDGFHSIATAARIPTKRVAGSGQLFGDMDKELIKVAVSEGATMIAAQLPPGRLPRQLLLLLRSSPAPVLIYKEASGAL